MAFPLIVLNFPEKTMTRNESLLNRKIVRREKAKKNKWDEISQIGWIGQRGQRGKIRR
jgi:hypothetical protein